MCGIAGVLEFDINQKPFLEGLKRMASVLAHRGPDEKGFYQSGQVGFAHRRLSIIDLKSGQQPMKSSDEQVCVVFNGEIYNYPELKVDLMKKGHEFRTQSDTEVLLALYMQYDLDAFSRINGMFACAFWNSRTNQLVLARDRFGKKPLFYYKDAYRFIFGSEIKALLAYGRIEKKVNLFALHEYITHGYIAGEKTIIEGIRRLPAAHVLILKNGHSICSPYWELKFQPASNLPDEVEVVEHLGELLLEAVRRRLIADVPLGAFLSGGLDSSTIVALMAQLSEQPVQTFAIGFEESDYSELQDAKIVARHLGTNHHEMIIKPSAIDILPNLVWHLDEPFGDSSAVPTYYVCKAAREYTTVALSGDGGDEVFAGYIRYRQLEYYRRMRLIPTWIRQRIIKPLNNVLPFTWPGWNYLYAMGRLSNGGLPCGLGIYPYIREKLYTSGLKTELREYNPFELEDRLLRKAVHLDPISRYQYLDTLHYLPADILTKVDRMSMANSLEVRSPMLDYTLVEYAATLPISLKLRGDVSKYILRKFCSQMLPTSVLTKQKQGFAIPKDRWFQRELRVLAEEILLDARAISRGYFRKESLRRLLHHHFIGRRDYSDWIWSLIVLEMWFRIFIDEQRVEQMKQVC